MCRFRPMVGKSRWQKWLKLVKFVLEIRINYQCDMVYGIKWVTSEFKHAASSCQLEGQKPTNPGGILRFKSFQSIESAFY